MWRLQLRGESNPRPIPGKKYHHFGIKITHRVFADLQNARLRNKVAIDKTHVFSENSSSRIDCIYAYNDVNVVYVRVSPNHLSDHNVLIVQVDIPLQASRGKGYWKNNVTCYQNEAFLIDLETKWKIWEKTQKSLGLVEWWIQVKNKVKKLVIEHSARLKHENSDIEII